MQPTPKDVHVDALLTNILIAYMNEPSAYIADQVFPLVPVRKQSAIIPEYRKEDFFRDHAQLRAPGTAAQSSGFAVVKTKTYYCDNYATAVEVPDEVRDNQDSPFDVDLVATELAATRLKIRRELSFATDFFKTTVWATDKTLTATWDDVVLGSPITDCQTAVDTIHASTGREARVMTIGRQVLSALRHHPDLIERIKYTQTAVLSVGLIASLLDLDTIHVGRALKVTSAEGATATLAYIFGKKALFTYTPSNPSLMVPSAGYTFHMTTFGGLGYVRRLREEREMVDVVEGHTFYDQKAVSTDCGYFIDNAVA